MLDRLSRTARRLSPHPYPRLITLHFAPVLAAFFVMAASLQGGQPVWYGEAETTRALYPFSTDSLNPSPEVLENPYGSPSAVVTVTEPFGTGWQDPADAFSTPGVDADGAWDVGPDGSIALTIPFTAGPTDPGLEYRVEFYLYVVAYEVPVTLPEISAPGLVLENVSSSTETVKQDTLGRYTGLTWTAEAPVDGGNTVDLLFEAATAGAVIDSIDVHTRVTTTGEPQNVYGAWTDENYPGETDPGVIGFDAVPEGDGLANGLKYYLGVGKESSARALTMVGGASGSAVFTHTRIKSGAPDVAASYEWSRNLVDWYADGQSDGSTSVSFGAVLTDDSHPDFDVHTVTATVTIGEPDRIFCRLTVSQTTD